MTPSEAGNRESGSASVELVAVLPFLLLAVVLAAQLALVGQALWSASIAARAGARAALVGSSAEVVAKHALPPPLRSGAGVEEGDAGVSVRVLVPRLLPLPQLGVAARSDLDGDDG